MNHLELINKPLKTLISTGVSAIKRKKQTCGNWKCKELSFPSHSSTKILSLQPLKCYYKSKITALQKKLKVMQILISDPNSSSITFFLWVKKFVIIIFFYHV